MSDKKIHFVSSDNEAAKEAKDNLVKKYKDYPASEADVIVTLGGDGLMLQTLHNNTVSYTHLTLPTKRIV